MVGGFGLRPDHVRWPDLYLHADATQPAIGHPSRPFPLSFLACPFTSFHFTAAAAPFISLKTPSFAFLSLFDLSFSCSLVSLQRPLHFRAMPLTCISFTFQSLLFPFSPLFRIASMHSIICIIRASLRQLRGLRSLSGRACATSRQLPGLRRSAGRARPPPLDSSAGFGRIAGDARSPPLEGSSGAGGGARSTSFRKLLALWLPLEALAQPSQKPLRLRLPLEALAQPPSQSSSELAGGGACSTFFRKLLALWLPLEALAQPPSAAVGDASFRASRAISLSAAGPSHFQQRPAQ